MIIDDKTELRKIQFNDSDFKKSSHTPAYPFTPYNCVMVAKKTVRLLFAILKTHQKQH